MLILVLLCRRGAGVATVACHVCGWVYTLARRVKCGTVFDHRRLLAQPLARAVGKGAVGKNRVVVFLVGVILLEVMIPGIWTSGHPFMVVAAYLGTNDLELTCVLQ